MSQPYLWLTAALLLAALLLLLAGRRRAGRRRPETVSLPGEWPLLPRRVFNAEERLLHRQLRQALPQHVVLAKLPLVRFCQPPRGGDTRYWFRLLGNVHVSFAVCDEAGHVLAVVDLEGPRGVSRRAQQTKDAVFRVLGLRYLRCVSGELPSLGELRALVPPLPAVTAATPVQASSERLSSTVASRRQQRNAPWADSSGVDSSFGALGGVVDDAPPPTLRH